MSVIRFGAAEPPRLTVVDQTFTPDAVAAVGAVPAVTLQADWTVAPDVVATVADVAAIATLDDWTVAPDVVVALADVPVVVVTTADVIAAEVGGGGGPAQVDMFFGRQPKTTKTSREPEALPVHATFTPRTIQATAQVGQASLPVHPATVQVAAAIEPADTAGPIRRARQDRELILIGAL